MSEQTVTGWRKSQGEMRHDVTVPYAAAKESGSFVMLRVRLYNEVGSKAREMTHNQELMPFYEK